MLSCETRFRIDARRSVHIGRAQPERSHTKARSHESCRGKARLSTCCRRTAFCLSFVPSCEPIPTDAGRSVRVRRAQPERSHTKAQSHESCMGKARLSTCCRRAAFCLSFVPFVLSCETRSPIMRPCSGLTRNETRGSMAGRFSRALPTTTDPPGSLCVWHQFVPLRLPFHQRQREAFPESSRIGDSTRSRSRSRTRSHIDPAKVKAAARQSRAASAPSAPAWDRDAISAAAPKTEDRRAIM